MFTLATWFVVEKDGSEAACYNSALYGSNCNHANRKIALPVFVTATAISAMGVIVDFAIYYCMGSYKGKVAQKKIAMIKVVDNDYKLVDDWRSLVAGISCGSDILILTQYSKQQPVKILINF